MKQTLIVILIIISLSGAYAIDRQSVLVIESYHSDYHWDKTYTRAISDKLSSHYSLSYYQLDTKRLPPAEQVKHVERAWTAFNELSPDLVILGDDNALKFMGPRIKHTDTPVVFLGINNSIRDYLPIKPTTFTGVLERPSARRTLRLISQLLSVPSPKILVLLDSGTTSSAVIASTFSHKNHISFFNTSADIKQIERYETWQKEILESDKNNYDAVIAGLYHTISDSNNNHIDDEHIIRWTSKNSPIPVFAFWDFAIGKDKAIGGLVQSGAEHGRIAGDMALRILSGESPSSISVVTAHKGRYIFSKTQLDRHSIVLPPSIESQAEIIE